MRVDDDDNGIGDRVTGGTRQAELDLSACAAAPRDVHRGLLIGLGPRARPVRVL
jgi:hypothetical protein